MANQYTLATPSQSTCQATLLSLTWRLLFAGYASVAAIWWYIEPQGFPILHSRFWANSGIPFLVTVVALLGIIGVFSRWRQLLKFSAPALSAATIAAAITARLLFPASLGGRIEMIVLGALVIGWCCFLLLLTWLTFRHFKEWPISRWGLALAVLFYIGIGVLVPWTQRSADATTHSGEATFSVETSDIDNQTVEPINLTTQVTIRPREGIIAGQCGVIPINAWPLLTFYSRSPDRFWTLFSPGNFRGGPPRTITGLTQESNLVTVAYADDDISRLQIKTNDASSVLAIEAFSKLTRPIYSHLNSFTQLQFYAQEKLTVSFSPAPDAQVEILQSDYPIGRPARLAYVDDDDRFRIVEATSGEKGPFKTLAEGNLLPEEPLHFTIFTAGEPMCQITLEDWAAQASRSLSPTAGWGVPQNAISFTLSGESRSGEALSTAFFNITLAGTGIGRGYDSVGHAPGIYQNRMTIESSVKKN
ncbi:MAG: hypothetical protein AAF702_02270 [Chloroflexota bacterium]